MEGEAVQRLLDMTAMLESNPRKDGKYLIGGGGTTQKHTLSGLQNGGKDDSN
jgi:hypothetical protein